MIFQSTIEKKIFTVAIVAKILLFVVVYSIFGTHGFFSTDDSWGYMRLAGNIVHEQVFSDATEPPFVPDALNTPGYPLYLAITAIPFGTAFISIIIQMILLSYATVLLYRMCTLFFSNKVSYVSALLFAVEPWNVYSATSVLSEAIFLFFFIFGLYFFIRFLHASSYRVAIYAGLSISVATLIRPITLYILPLCIIVALVVALYRGRSKIFILHTTMFVCCMYVFVVGWSVRNLFHFDSFSLTTKGAYTLYFYDAAQFLVYKDKITPAEAQERLIARAQKDYPEISVKDDLKHVKYGPYLTKETFRVIGESPILYAKMHTISFATFLLSDGYRLLLRELRLSEKTLPNISLAIFNGDVRSIVRYFVSEPISGLLFILGFAFWLVINTAAALSIVVAWVKKENIKVLALLVCFALCVLYFGFIIGPVAQARYRVPITIFLFPMAIYTLAACKTLLFSRNRV